MDLACECGECDKPVTKRVIADTLDRKDSIEELLCHVHADRRRRELERNGHVNIEVEDVE